MEQKIFLKLDDIRGESQNPRHPGAIEVFSFTFGSKIPNGPAGRGRASIKDLTLTKRSDAASPFLYVACHSGRYFAKAVLTVEDLSAAGNVLRSTIIEMLSMHIEFIKQDNEMESVDLDFKDLKIRNV